MRTLVVLVAPSGAGKSHLIATAFIPAGWLSLEGLSPDQTRRLLTRADKHNFIVACSPQEAELWEKVHVENLHKQFWRLEIRKNDALSRPYPG
jgi:predicted kinase